MESRRIPSSKSFFSAFFPYGYKGESDVLYCATKDRKSKVFISTDLKKHVSEIVNGRLRGRSLLMFFHLLLISIWTM